ncbi:MAG TPA: ribokinase [Acidimicrobiales bacterium]|jgi:ribokinase|nr:ribokinase [Acidimicrobiales bacterium]
MSAPRICVVGSANIDLLAYAPRLPRLGETLPGDRFLQRFGGKGANQAVMAAKLGAQVAMVAKLGDDLFGREYLANLRDVGVDTTHVGVSAEASTGVAPIWVDESSGNNAIIVVLGTNLLLSTADVDAARDAIASAQVVVSQWEVPIATVVAAFEIARAAGVTTVFNPAPAQGALPDEVFALTDILCPNESETESLTGLPVGSVEEVEAAARTLLARGAGRVICTLGSRGSLLVGRDEVVHVPTDPVQAVDTTGAGDAFVGSLAYFIGRGLTITDAMRRASRIAARSVLLPGAQTSFPSAADVPDLLT